MSEYDETHGINRKPAGAAESTGGRFDNRDRLEAKGVTLEQPSDHDLRVKALDELEATGEMFSLHYTDYTEEMSDGLLRLVLAGDYAEYWSKFNETFDDADYDDLDAAIQRFDDEHGTDFASLSAGDEDYDRLENYLWGHDDSDREADLLRFTEKKMMRAPISGYGTLDGNDTYWANPNDEKAWNQLSARREKLLSDRLADAGLDMSLETNKDAVKLLVSEGPETWHEGVRLDVIWNGDVRDAIPGDVERVLNFQNPHVVLIDTLNGSGYDDKFTGIARMTIGARPEDGALSDGEHVRLDDEEHGYGWDQTAGLVHSAYNTHVAATNHEPVTG